MHSILCRNQAVFSHTQHMYNSLCGDTGIQPWWEVHICVWWSLRTWYSSHQGQLFHHEHGRRPNRLDLFQQLSVHISRGEGHSGLASSTKVCAVVLSLFFSPQVLWPCRQADHSSTFPSLCNILLARWADSVAVLQVIPQVSNPQGLFHTKLSCSVFKHRHRWMNYRSFQYSTCGCVIWWF